MGSSSVEILKTDFERELSTMFKEDLAFKADLAGRETNETELEEINESVEPSAKIMLLTLTLIKNEAEQKDIKIVTKYTETILQNLITRIKPELTPKELVLHELYLMAKIPRWFPRDDKTI